MHIEHCRNGESMVRSDASHVMSHRGRDIERAPPKQLSAPGHVGVLAIGEELRIEKLARHGYIGDHLPAIESRGGARSEDVLHLAEAAIVGLVPAPIEM